MNNLFPINDPKLEKNYRAKEATEGTIKLEEDTVKNVGNVKKEGISVRLEKIHIDKTGPYIGSKDSKSCYLEVYYQGGWGGDGAVHLEEEEGR